MLDKLIKVEEKFEDINKKLCQSDVVNDMAQYKKLMQELKVLTPIVEKFRQLKAAQSTLDEAKEMLDAGGLEKDFREMVQEEYEQAVEEMREYPRTLAAYTKGEGRIFLNLSGYRPCNRQDEIVAASG